MIIGLTGPNASGKGEAASYLRTKGFKYHSLSDALREEAEKSGIEPLRENLIRLGNELRRKNSPSYLASIIGERLTEPGNYIVDSIRNPAEAEALQEKKGFVLLGIDAPVEVRFKRSLKRRRPGDAETLQDFIEKEKRENLNNPENQQLKKCIEMADVVIVNDSAMDEFYRKIDEAITEKT
ncbi:MAG: AAA family ATPase [Candidatus Omnitrophica bacterium]|nr:AAA family ATPase [Candidatus Omnitrophota bacterium]